MPYLVYKIFPPKKLEYVETFEAYREARDKVRTMRAELGSADDYTVKMIHARHQMEAERLLTEEREKPPLGDD